jgi:hypothetical protein
MMKSFILFSVLVYTCLTLHERVHDSEYRQLKMQGNIYPNSCNKEQKSVLWEMIAKAKVYNGPQALKLVDLILCASDSKENRKVLMSSFGKGVREKVESTGGATLIKTIAVTEKIVSRTMAAGNVWNTTLLTEQKKISLQYFVNEACVKSATLLYSHSKWSVYEIGEACD